MYRVQLLQWGHSFDAGVYLFEFSFAEHFTNRYLVILEKIGVYLFEFSLAEPECWGLLVCDQLPRKYLDFVEFQAPDLDVFEFGPPSYPH